jgi:hypothetical protein
LPPCFVAGSGPKFSQTSTASGTAEVARGSVDQGLGHLQLFRRHLGLGGFLGQGGRLGHLVPVVEHLQNQQVLLGPEQDQLLAAVQDHLGQGNTIAQVATSGGDLLAGRPAVVRGQHYRHHLFLPGPTLRKVVVALAPDGELSNQRETWPQCVFELT